MEGKIDSIQDFTLTVNGRVVYLENTKIEGTISVGAQVEVEGYFASDGRFVAVKIEVEGSSSGDNGNNVNSAMTTIMKSIPTMTMATKSTPMKMVILQLQ